MGSVASVFANCARDKYKDTVSDVFDNKELSILISQNPVLRAYFVKYIKLGTWIEKFPNYAPETRILSDLHKKSHDFVSPAISEINRSVSSLDFSTYGSVMDYFGAHSRSNMSLKSLVAGTQVCKLNKLKSFSFERESCKSEESVVMCYTDFGLDSNFSLDEMAAIFFVCIYPYFRESGLFQTFQSRLFSQCESTKSIDSVDFISKDEEISHHTHSPTSRELKGGSHAQKLVYNAAALFAEDQLYQMLSTTEWYDNHIPSIIDNNSLSITVCAADNEEEGFPLLYVNKAFESLTGYSKQDVLHKNPKFLQGPKTNMDAVSRIAYALRRHHAVKEELINYKKNGKEFQNLIVLSPVFDKLGIFTHVIGIQLDISVYPVSPQDIKQMEDLLALLPRMISTKLDIKVFQML